MYSYLAYGLRIRSAIALPEFVSTSNANSGDVMIRLARVQPLTTPPTQLGWNFHLASESQATYLRWETVGSFLVSGGSEISADLNPGVDEAWVRLALLGMCMTVLLHQRGLLVLHGSGIAIDGTEAVVFLGNKGQGKSTIAATLYGQGHRLLTDDVVAIDLENPKRPLVAAGFPQLKLFPESAVASLGHNPELLSSLAPGVEKLAHRLKERFSTEPLPLKCVCVLKDGRVPRLIELTSQDAIAALIGHSYAARFGAKLLGGSRAVAHLRQCALLLNSVTVYGLERPRALELVPVLARLVTDHLRLKKSVTVEGFVASHYRHQPTRLGPFITVRAPTEERLQGKDIA